MDLLAIAVSTIRLEKVTLYAFNCQYKMGKVKVDTHTHSLVYFHEKDANQDKNYIVSPYIT